MAIKQTIFLCKKHCCIIFLAPDLQLKLLSLLHRNELSITRFDHFARQEYTHLSFLLTKWTFRFYATIHTFSPNMGGIYRANPPDDSFVVFLDTLLPNLIFEQVVP